MDGYARGMSAIESENLLVDVVICEHHGVFLSLTNKDLDVMPGCYLMYI